MVHFILVQAVCFLGTIIFFLSYQCRSNRNLFRMQLASYLCYMTHMFLLGALTGGNKLHFKRGPLLLFKQSEPVFTQLANVWGNLLLATGDPVLDLE